MMAVARTAERWRCRMKPNDEWDDYDPCYECTGYGDDYSIDENGELVWNCPDCPFNEKDDE